MFRAVGVQSLAVTHRIPSVWMRAAYGGHLETLLPSPTAAYPPSGGAMGRLSQRCTFVEGTRQIMVANTDAPAFTGKDRDLLRMEFMDRFGSAVSIHEGFWVKRWSTGSRKGQPKISPTLASLIDRDLLRIVEAESGMPRACFTDAGLRALIALAEDRRAFQPPERYSHLLAEIAALRQTS
jgi:hypothetical protein